MGGPLGSRVSYPRPYKVPGSVEYALQSYIDAKCQGNRGHASTMLGYSYSFLTAVLNGKKACPEPILRELGLKKVVTYERVGV